MPAKLKGLVEKGEERVGWTSAADIVREMEGEGNMTLQRNGREGREGGREVMMIQTRGNKVC